MSRSSIAPPAQGRQSPTAHRMHDHRTCRPVAERRRGALVCPSAGCWGTGQVRRRYGRPVADSTNRCRCLGRRRPTWWFTRWLLMRQSPTHPATRWSPEASNRPREVDLWLTLAGPLVTVERLPGWVAYPRPRAFVPPVHTCARASWRLPSQHPVNRARLQPQLVPRGLVVHVSNGQVQHDGSSTANASATAVDDRVHLYGGLTRETDLTR
jgi:hypothetical protein